MYLRVREILALAADYDATRKESIEFFRIIQNKLDFAGGGAEGCHRVPGGCREGSARPEAVENTAREEVVNARYRCSERNGREETGQVCRGTEPAQRRAAGRESGTDRVVRSASPFP